MASYPQDRAGLVSACTAGEIFEFRLFYGHRPGRPGAVDQACLSQWWEAHPFVIGRATYPTAEHWMMAAKARLFKDSAGQERILRARGPAEAKRLGREVKGFDDQAWSACAGRLVVAGNLAKFSNHPDLARYLLSTGDAVLVEASPTDRIWGVGLCREDARASDPRSWRGENRLGFALMNVRQTLRVSATGPDGLSAERLTAIAITLAETDPLVGLLKSAGSSG
jgi:ribA/ribD-fused uncharacterized protein